jgi:hypothetical protein
VKKQLLRFSKTLLPRAIATFFTAIATYQSVKLEKNFGKMDINSFEYKKTSVSSYLIPCINFWSVRDSANSTRAAKADMITKIMKKSNSVAISIPRNILLFPASG